MITIGQNFAGLVAESFDQIRGSAEGDLGVMLRVLGSLQTLKEWPTMVINRRSQVVG